MILPLFWMKAAICARVSGRLPDHRVVRVDPEGVVRRGVGDRRRIGPEASVPLHVRFGPMSQTKYAAAVLRPAPERSPSVGRPKNGCVESGRSRLRSTRRLAERSADRPRLGLGGDVGDLVVAVGHLDQDLVRRRVRQRVVVMWLA